MTTQETGNVMKETAQAIPFIMSANINTTLAKMIAAWRLLLPKCAEWDWNICLHLA